VKARAGAVTGGFFARIIISDEANVPAANAAFSRANQLHGIHFCLISTEGLQLNMLF
jgi:hypothetical protein